MNWRGGLLAMLCGCTLAHGAPATDDAVVDAVDFSPRRGAMLPDALRLVDAGGQPQALAALRADKPLLLTLAWFNCANLCGMTLNNLADAVARAKAGAGTDYQVLVLGLDPGETPADARREKNSLAQRYPDAGIEPGWHFMTGSPDAVETLAEALGFAYVYDPRKDQFAHPAGVVMADAEGRIADFHAGVNFSAAVIQRLLRAGRGEPVSSDANPLLLLCYDYDPRSGQYSLAIVKVLRVLALAFVTAGIALWGWYMIRERRNNRGGPPHG